MSENVEKQIKQSRKIELEIINQVYFQKVLRDYMPWLSQSVDRIRSALWDSNDVALWVVFLPVYLVQNNRFNIIDFSKTVVHRIVENKKHLELLQDDKNSDVVNAYANWIDIISKIQQETTKIIESYNKNYPIFNNQDREDHSAKKDKMDLADLDRMLEQL